MRAVRFISASVVGLLLLLALPSSVWAQGGDHPMEAKGVVPEHGSVSFFPWEHIDTYTGNVVLSFADFVLPGNAGFTLVVSRTFNAKDQLWLFAVGPDMHMPDEMNDYPAVYPPDGGELQMFLKSDGVFVTASLWRYTWAPNVADRKLEMPNGTVCHFYGGELRGRLKEMQDPFGNRVEVFYDEAGRRISSVVQYLGNGQSREVVFTYGTNEDTITYNGRTWRYVWGSIHTTPPDVLASITQVIPPEGPPWNFEYWMEIPEGGYRHQYRTRVTTPTGGWVEYEVWELEYGPSNPELSWTTPKLKYRRVGTSATPDATWTFDYDNEGRSTTVDCPNVYVAGFYHDVWGEAFKTPVLHHMAATGSDDTTITWQTGASLGTPQSFLDPPYDPIVDDVTFVPRVVTRTRDGRSYTRTYSYDTNDPLRNFDQPITVDEAGDFSRTTTYTYHHFTAAYLADRVGQETVSNDSDSFTTSYGFAEREHPDNGFMTSKTVLGVTTTYEPDTHGNVWQQTDANSHTTSFDYSWGVVSAIHTPQYTTEFGINANGETDWARQRGQTTTFQYDGLGRQTAQTPPAGNATTTEYAPDGRSVTARRGPSWTRTELDAFGRVIGTENSVGVRTGTTYDVLGRSTYVSYPFTTEQKGTSFQYDDRGRVTQKTNPDGSGVMYAYGGDSGGLHVAITDENGHQTTQAWQACGTPAQSRLTSVTDTDGHATSYAYTLLGSLTHVLSPGGLTRTWSYNGQNRLTSQTQPELGTVSYGYDDVGNLILQTDARDQTTTYSYDGNNRLTHIESPDSHYSTDISYDDSNNRTHVANGYVTSDFVYDAANRLTKRTDVINGRTFVTEFTPDGNGNVVDVKYPSGNHVQYAYDDENRITRLFDDTRGLVFARDFTYHPSGGLAAYTSGDGIVHTIEYDDRYRPTRVAADGLLDLQYEGPNGQPGYDGVGNVTFLTDGLRPDRSATFGYDALDRLTSANGGGWGNLAYGYDPLGNRTSKTHNGAVTIYTYTGQRLTATSGGETDPEIVYDVTGNLTHDAGGDYTYTPTNMLETASVAGGTALYTYRYDGDNQRVLKSGSGNATYYVHGLGELLSEFEEVNGSARWRVDYVYAGSRLLAAVRPPVTRRVTVTKTPGGGGTVTSSPAGISCGAVCAADFAVESVVTLTATPAGGWQFAGWSGGCSGSSATTTVTVTADTTCGARFANLSDVNGDGKADLVWRNYATGTNTVWYMDGATLVGWDYLETVTDTSWQIAAVGDLNGDGKSDLVWRNSATGVNTVWYMDGATRLGWDYLETVSVTSWQIVAAGDVNGDGKADLVWRDSVTGTNTVWYMDGATRLGWDYLETVSDTTWQIAAAGDVNGDGKVDIVWRNAVTGTNTVWYLDGTTCIGWATLDAVTDTTWQIGAVADFNGDGKVDIVWRNSVTGTNTVWYLDGTTCIGWATLETVADTNWVIVNT